MNTQTNNSQHTPAGLDGFAVGEANARLIAAAPELAQALKALTKWGRDTTSPRDPNSPHALLVAAVDALQKAGVSLD
jgi:hypothetical protein